MRDGRLHTKQCLTKIRRTEKYQETMFVCFFHKVKIYKRGAVEYPEVGSEEEAGCVDAGPVGGRNRTGRDGNGAQAVPAHLDAAIDAVVPVVRGVTTFKKVGRSA